VPRGIGPATHFGAKRDVDYGNVMTAFPKDDKGHGHNPFGAISRGHSYDEIEFIHPLRPDCDVAFVYTLDGEIAPSDCNSFGPPARTIDHLRLNSSVLNELRRAAIDARCSSKLFSARNDMMDDLRKRDEP